ncbi:MAG TPA: hypothetical protein VGS23_03870 [Thermoplasmata archaeon]|nr:hypothetical protein [Thermoplasmata archaeon]
MSRVVDLSLLSRRELENLALTEHGLLARILKAIRDGTEEGWRLRREIEDIVDRAMDRRPLVAAYVRSSEAQIERARAERNAAQWERWLEVET